MKLTAAAIRTLKLPPSLIDKVFFDSKLPGFGLHVRASGVHSWMIQYAIAGRTRRVVLGLASALDPGKARATAKDCWRRSDLVVTQLPRRITPRPRPLRPSARYCPASWRASARASCRAPTRRPSAT
jgi:hypothetical protein